MRLFLDDRMLETKHWAQIFLRKTGFNGFYRFLKAMLISTDSSFCLESKGGAILFKEFLNLPEAEAVL